MKVLFLDIDGVLNCASDFTPEQGTYCLDQKKVARLVEFLKETGVMVVLSSSWRNHHDHVEFLREQGVLSEIWLHPDWRTEQLLPKKLSQSRNGWVGTQK